MSKINSHWLRKNGYAIDQPEPLPHIFNDVFKHFVNPQISTCSMLTNSSLQSMNFLFTLIKCDAYLNSPYVSIRRDNFNTQIRKILVKVSLIRPSRARYTASMTDAEKAQETNRAETETLIMMDHRTNSTKENFSGKQYNFRITSHREMKDEVAVQRDIFRRSLRWDEFFFNPICPGIYYSSLDDESQATSSQIIALITTNIETSLQPGTHGRIKWDAFKDAKTPNGCTLGIIGMEYMDGYVTANEVFATTEGVPLDWKHCYENIRYMIQRLNEMGYKHGDTHGGNFLVKRNSPFRTSGFGNVVNFSPIIIDFGQTISSPHLFRNTLCDDGEFTRDDFDGKVPGIVFEYSMIKTMKREIMSCLMDDEAKISKGGLFHRVKTYFIDSEWIVRGIEVQPNYFPIEQVREIISIWISYDKYTLREFDQKLFSDNAGTPLYNRTIWDFPGGKLSKRKNKNKEKKSIGKYRS